MRISDWSSDVCSSDLRKPRPPFRARSLGRRRIGIGGEPVGRVADRCGAGRIGGRLRERRRRKHRGPDSERGAANKNTDDHEGKVSPCTRIVTCAGDRRICFPDGTDKLTRAHRQPGKALLLSIARSPLAPAHVPELPSIAGVALRVARARYKTWDRCDLTFVTLDPGTHVAGVLTQSKCPSPEVEWCRAALTLGSAGPLVVNAGNANDFTGNRGRAAGKAITDAAARSTTGRQPL